MKKVDILAIIPARGGSKRIPQKNIMNFCGKPLIYYTIREVKKSKMIDAFLVSTDDKKIAKISKKLGADVPFYRPIKYSKDNSKDIEFLKHALSWVRKNRNWNPKILVFLPPTTPSRTSKDIDNALKFMLKEKADSVRTMVFPYHFNPFKMWILDNEKKKKVKHIFPKNKNGVDRKKIEKYFMPVAAVYAMKSNLIDKNEMWGDDVRCIEFPIDRFVDIDRVEDIKPAERVMKKFNLI
jgi:CMP-N,N'-diacetyllegionaminic acid synthase